jgi:anti-sigma regulatory factor (Ser/Thr protein kinase)
MGTLRGVLPLPSTPQAAGLARDHVRALGSAWSPQGLETVLLAVSEAVTNAVRYGRGDIGLDVRVDDGVVRVEVSDANPEPPHRRPRSGDGLAEGGLGLHLLDAITQDWGTSTRPDGPGKTVWMELRPPAAGA